MSRLYASWLFLVVFATSPVFALKVEINQPPDPFIAYTNENVAFVGKASDADGRDVTADAEWIWYFDGGKGEKSNPVVHAFPPAGLGAGSVTWNGETDAGPPAAMGVYAFQVLAEHHPGPGILEHWCKDLAFVDLVTEVSLSGFQWDMSDFPHKAAVSFHYDLSADADDLDLRLYKPKLGQATIESPTTLESTAGPHDPVVVFDVDSQETGNYSFVLISKQTPTEGMNNRSMSPKWGVTRGAVQEIVPNAVAVAGDGECFLDFVYAATETQVALARPGTLGWLEYSVGTCGLGTESLKEALSHSAVFTHIGHGDQSRLVYTGTPYLTLDDIDSLKLDHLLLAVWYHCHSGEDYIAGSENWVDKSIARGVDCAVGWRGFAGYTQTMPDWCRVFWNTVWEGIDSPLPTPKHAPVYSACALASAYAYTLDGNPEILSWVVKGDQSLHLGPARFGACGCGP